MKKLFVLALTVVFALGVGSVSYTYAQDKKMEEKKDDKKADKKDMKKDDKKDAKKDDKKDMKKDDKKDGKAANPCAPKK